MSAGNFLYNNYVQAITIIKEYKPQIEAFKHELQITDNDIEGWIVVERCFLEDLKEEPQERVLACAYVEALTFRQKAE